MDEIRAKGHIMSFFVYFLCGVAFAGTFMLKKGDAVINYAIAAIFFWLLTCVLLLAAGLGRYKDGRIFEMLHIIFLSVFGISVQIYWNLPFMLYLIFTLQWLMSTSFLRKQELHLLAVVQTGSLLFLTFTPTWVTGFQSFTPLCMAVTICGLLLADWIGCNLINALFQMKEENEEHDRSLDDLLEIVEAKHREAKEANLSKSEAIRLFNEPSAEMDPDEKKSYENNKAIKKKHK